MQNQSEDLFGQFQRNQLDLFAENPSILEAQQIAFKQSIDVAFIQRQYLEERKKSEFYDKLQSHKWHQIQGEQREKILGRNFSGIKIMFGLQSVEQDSPQNVDFLEEIDTKIFEDDKLLNLNNFFKEEQNMSEETHYNTLVENLTDKMSLIQKKAFSSLSMNKTFGRAFYQHFQRFSNFYSINTFSTKFAASLQKLMNQASKLSLQKGNTNLIVMIYQFWMRMFRDFVRQIWKYSQKFTIDIFRKKKIEEHIDGVSRSCRSSTSSSQVDLMLQKEKRKAWKKDELDYLKLTLENFSTINQIKVKQLSNYLGRSQHSIYSKINKLQKAEKSKEFHKIEQESNILTHEQKVLFALKDNYFGMTKEEVIMKIEDSFEMGQQQTWKKSVSQILSSKDAIDKMKGVYSLINPEFYTKCKSTTSMREKLIQCFNKCERYEADLKKLTKIYMGLFDKEGYNKQKAKITEISISKALCRYDIFDKKRAKTLYRILPQSNKDQQNEDYSMDIEEYIK